MQRAVRMFCRMRLWKDVRGQDIVEYALVGGVLTCAAGAFTPSIAAKIRTIFGNIGTRMNQPSAGTQL